MEAAITPPQERGIRSSHRVLHCVADEQQKSEIEGRHLPDFAFTTQANAQEHDAVNDRRAQRNLQQDTPARKRCARH